LLKPLIEAALNGARSADEASGLPVSGAELAEEARLCVAAGARAIHLHPRGDDGRESLASTVVDRVVNEVRAACRVPVGVTTGAWIVVDPIERAALIRRWRAADFASVNPAEDGAEEVIRACRDAGVGVEAGLASVEDAQGLADSGLAPQVLRVLIEIPELEESEALTLASEINEALGELEIAAPRLQHGERTCS